MSNDFQKFMSQLSETNATLDYFTDFDKVIENIKPITLKLNQLNYLIGKENLEQAINEIYEENPKSFEVLDILIAVRKKDKKKVISATNQVKLLSDYFHSPKQILTYIESTGLATIFKNKNITNLVDYVFGIEVGLDTNARKNRGGSNMETLVASVFDAANIFYKREVNSDIFPVIKSLGKDIKCFDFVIKTKTTTYLIETNFYNVGGSKLSEIARAYSDVAPKINEYKDYEFVWITDGEGWHTPYSKTAFCTQ
jgi:type II restriction enzyme